MFIARADRAEAIPDVNLRFTRNFTTNLNVRIAGSVHWTMNPHSTSLPSPNLRAPANFERSRIRHPSFVDKGGSNLEDNRSDQNLALTKWKCQPVFTCIRTVPYPRPLSTCRLNSCREVRCTDLALPLGRATSPPCHGLIHSTRCWKASRPPYHRPCAPPYTPDWGITNWCKQRRPNLVRTKRGRHHCTQWLSVARGFRIQQLPHKLQKQGLLQHNSPAWKPLSDHATRSLATFRYIWPVQNDRSSSIEALRLRRHGQQSDCRDASHHAPETLHMVGRPLVGLALSESPIIRQS